MEETYAEVKWTAEDITSLRPDWTMEQCHSFLQQEEKHIRDRITELGWEVINSLLPPPPSSNFNEA